MDALRRLSARHLTSRQFLVTSAKKVRVKISHRDAATNARRRWQARARVVSSQDTQAQCAFLRETARTWRAQEGKATYAEFQPQHDICRPQRPHRIRAAVRGRPAIPPCNFRSESCRRLAC